MVMQMVKDIFTERKDLTPYNKIIGLVTENVGVGDTDYTQTI